MDKTLFPLYAHLVITGELTLKAPENFDSNIVSLKH